MMVDKATFVIVHGGWGGGWEWTPIARELRARGYEVFTPTLTGLGERAHLGGERVGLSTHIEDVLAVLAFEELDDVVLCGHSYSGMVVTGVADRAPERIRLLVYLDAFAPRDGQALTDLLPAEFVKELLGSSESGKIPILLSPPEGAVAEDVRQRYIARLRPHPVDTNTEVIQLSGSVERLPRALVRCTADPDKYLFEGTARRAHEEGWIYREIESVHDLHLVKPEKTVSVLDDLGASVSGARSRYASEA